MSAVTGNRATAQSDMSELPDAADGLDPMAPIAPPAVKFTDAAGQRLSLADYRGHVLVVNFWATWCGPCVDELPTLAALAAQIQSFGGLVLPISIDTGGARTVRPFYARHAIANLPILLDPDGENLDRLDVDGVPVTLVIDPQGRLAGRVVGAGNWDTPRIIGFLRSLVPAQHKAKPSHVTAL